MLRYFQHIDPSDDERFLKVTTLDYIDDVSYPTTRLYYFADGSCCNKLYVAPLNTTDDKINKYAMAEIVNPNMKWDCEKIDIKPNVRTAVNANGEKVIISDPYMDDTNVKPGTKYNFTAPDYMPIERYNKTRDDIETWQISNIISKLKKDGSFTKTELDIKSKIPAFYLRDYVNVKEEKPVTEVTTAAPIVVDEPEHKPVSKTTEACNTTPAVNMEGEAPVTLENQKITADQFIELSPAMDPKIWVSGNNPVAATTYIDTTCCNAWGNSIMINDSEYPIVVSISKSNDITRAALAIDGHVFTAQEVHEVMNKHYEKKLKGSISSEASNIAESIGAEPETYGILNNMIKNAVKNQATASVDIDLDLPPVEVYKLLSAAYPEEWKSVFIKIIAHNVSVESLRKALAAGLEHYYTDGIDNNLTSKTAE